MDIALPLKAARANRGLTQAQLAYITEITNVTISNIENGQVHPNESTKEKIEEIVGPVDWERTYDLGHVKRQILTN